MRCHPLPFVTALLTFVPLAAAEVKTRAVTYTHDGVELQGHMAWDDAIEGKRPGVLVVHEWWGLNDYARKRAEQLASMGYVAFALDMYGKGKVAEHATEARQWATQVRQNVEGWRARALKGLDVLRNDERVDKNRIAAIGYCFGGSTVLQLAFAGADIKGVVSFHGALMTPTEEQVKNLKAKILICHGAADAFIPEESIQPFRAALDKGEADYQMIYYAGAQHSFTNPGADKAGMQGMKYDPDADRRSWAHMKMFFDELFAK